ncbi:MAG: hypothetical protein ACOYWZ_00150 [Bacillota bacterium]
MRNTNKIMHDFYKKIDKIVKTDDVYEGTVLDFCLDCLAARMSLEQIQSRYRNIWKGGEIKEEEILQLIDGHEQELQERKKKFRELIRSSSFVNVAVDCINELLNDAKKTSNLRIKAQILIVLNGYLKYFLQTEDNKAMIDTIKQKLSYDDVKNFIESKSEKVLYIRENGIIKK